MKQPTVLVVDNNPLTRKVVRISLESEGYVVLEASNGKAGLELVESRAIDLILQDLVLPDVDGLKLVEDFRALPQGKGIPIIAFSGFPSKISQARNVGPGFTDYILKPIEPSRLSTIIRTHVDPGNGSQEPGRGRRVLVIDDDPVQRKLMRIHLEQSGFTVDTAADGLDGLEQARRRPPDAIVSDVLMPKLDGFKFCVEVRQDTRIDRIPIVLSTAAFVEDADRKLAEAAGASAFVVRTPNIKDIIEALLASLDNATQASENRPVELPVEEYADRVMRQLERQVTLGSDTARRLAWIEGNLSILAGIAETLKRASSPDLLTDDILYQGLEAMGAAKGAAYLIGPDGRPAVRTTIGFQDVPPGDLSEFFGHLELVRWVLETGEPVEIPSTLVDGEQAAFVLQRTEAAFVLITPLVSGRRSLGAFMAAWPSAEAAEEARLLAIVVAAQISQAIDLVLALSRLGESEDHYRRMVETAGEGIWTVDGENKTAFVNSRMANMLGYSVEEMLGRPFSTFVAAEDCPAPALGAGRNGAVEQHDCKLTGKDGREIWTIVSSTCILDKDGEYAGALRMVTDITERKQMEESRNRLLAEVRARAAEIAAANKELEAFSYSVSHDLRSPVRHLDGFSKALIEDYGDKLDQRGVEYLRFIRSAAQTMGMLIDDLLKLSRVTRAEMRIEEVDLSTVAHSIVTMLQTDYPERSVEVIICPSVAAKGDPILLRVVLQNLFENAWKFTSRREDARIEFGLATSDDEPTYYVRDNGVGFDMTYAYKLFGAFQRLHAAEEFPGTGIGLATVERIIHRHGGRIWAEAAVGKGATFHFTLP